MLSSKYRVRKVIHVILDNYATHKHPKVLAWLTRHPRWTFHFTPTSSSWLTRCHAGQVRDAAPSLCRESVGDRGVRRLRSSWPTYYQAKADFEEGGIAGLAPKKRCPRGPQMIQGEVLAFLRAQISPGQLHKASWIQRKLVY